MVLMFDSVKAHYKAVCSSDKIEKNIDIRHYLLSYTKDLHPAPVCQNNPCSEAAELL